MVLPYYEPREDSFLILEEVKRFAKGSVLDMGTGSGVLAIEAAKRAGSVLAVDINKAALRAAAENAKREGIRNIRFVHSDLFQNIRGRFDVIVFNPPYLPRDSKVEEDKSIYGGEKGYELTERFIEACPEYLRDDGFILLLFSSLTNKDKIDEILKRKLLVSTLLSTDHFFFETLYVYLIKKSDVLVKLNRIRGLVYLSKGKRGLIYSGSYKKTDVAIKIKNPFSMSPARIIIEANVLEALNRKGIGPKMLFYDEDFIVMELVEGTFIIDYFYSNSRREIIRIIKEVFDQLYVLDKMHINKDEMSHPQKHIIVRKGKPVLIDFERAKYSKKVHNVTQFCQFLCSREIRKILENKGIIVDKEEIIRISREYYQKPSQRSLNSILKGFRG